MFSLLKKIAVFTGLSVMPFSFYAQTENSSNLSAEAYTAYLKQLSVELNGTYQVQMINTRALPTFDMRMLEDIKNKRLQSDTLYLPVSDIQRVMVLPKDAIENPNFQGVEYCKHIDQ